MRPKRSGVLIRAAVCAVAKRCGPSTQNKFIYPRFTLQEVRFLAVLALRPSAIRARHGASIDVTSCSIEASPQSILRRRSGRLLLAVSGRAILDELTGVADRRRACLPRRFNHSP